MLAQYYNKGMIEAGCDEAGRGCLAGPVYAAAVILPPDYHNELLNDSKQLTERQRYTLRTQIEKDAVAWAVASVDNEEIDNINILRASFHAMSLAVKQLNTPTAKHYDAIERYGITPLHRKSFALYRQKELEFDTH